MKTQIRDIDIIEKELTSNYLGVLSFIYEDENIIQIPVTYLYYDKNIYFLAAHDDDELNNIPFGTSVKFTIIKNVREKGEKSLYKLLTVFISGTVKFIEDAKQTDELRKSYNKKYNLTDENELKILMVDTVEFQAFQYSGG